jgi:hypothetical protein
MRILLAGAVGIQLCALPIVVVVQMTTALSLSASAQTQDRTPAIAPPAGLTITVLDGMKNCLAA